MQELAVTEGEGVVPFLLSLVREECDTVSRDDEQFRGSSRNDVDEQRRRMLSLTARWTVGWRGLLDLTGSCASVAQRGVAGERTKQEA